MFVDKIDSKNRLYVIDLLKAIAIFLVVLSHSMPKYNPDMPGYINVLNSTTDIQHLILIIINYLGQFGNAIFIICSAWFLVDCDKVNWKKVKRIIFDTCFISILFLLIFIVSTGMLPDNFIQYIFPITFRHNWFVPCYLIFYILHPLINYGINYYSLNKKENLKYVFIIFILYSFIATVIPNAYCSSELSGFFIIYIIVSVIKNGDLKNVFANKKTRKNILSISLIGFFLYIFILNYLGNRVGGFANKIGNWTTFYNPIIIFCSISFFLYFIYNKYNSRSVVCLVSKITLLIYIIHENKIIREYTRGILFKKLFENGLYDNYLVLSVLVYAIALFIFSILVAIVYNTLTKNIMKCNEK